MGQYLYASTLPTLALRVQPYGPTALLYGRQVCLLPATCRHTPAPRAHCCPGSAIPVATPDVFLRTSTMTARTAEEAPVLRPTMEEFRDFEGFMSSCFELGMRYGIVKVQVRLICCAITQNPPRAPPLCRRASDSPRRPGLQPPPEWTDAQPQLFGAGGRCERDLTIPTPIQQNVNGGQGVFECIYVEKRPMHLSRFQEVRSVAQCLPQLSPPVPPWWWACVRSDACLACVDAWLRRGVTPRGSRLAGRAVAQAASASRAALGKQWAQHEEARNYDALEKAFWKGLQYGAPPMYGADMVGTMFTPGLESWHLNELDTILQRLLREEQVEGVLKSYLCALLLPTPATPALISTVGPQVLGHGARLFRSPHGGHGPFLRELSAWWGAQIVVSQRRRSPGDSLLRGGAGAWLCALSRQGVSRLPLLPCPSVAGVCRWAVPPRHANRVESFAQGTLPAHARQCPQFLRHKTTMIAPSRFLAESIPVTHTVQEAGQFVITFPRGYHWGFNQGFNCAEAVNFATEDWLPHGQRSSWCRCRPDSVRIDMGQLLRRLHHAKVDSAQHARPGQQQQQEEGEGDEPVGCSVFKRQQLRRLKASLSRRWAATLAAGAGAPTKKRPAAAECPCRPSHMQKKKRARQEARQGCGAAAATSTQGTEATVRQLLVDLARQVPPPAHKYPGRNSKLTEIYDFES
jgi:hypothetical protein|eukprot:COSAG01_NODE_1946_length_8829_cov_909.234937_3_plen_688_part_00